MLGGLDYTHDDDVKASLDFCREFTHGIYGSGRKLLKPARFECNHVCGQFMFAKVTELGAPTDRMFVNAALDCGAGIGRVTKHMLIPASFRHVDLVESSEAFCTAAKEFLVQEIRTGQVAEIINTPLQAFVPPVGKYNLIWCQWVLLYLDDGMLIIRDIILAQAND